MARDEDDDDSLPPLGENTDKFLEDVKKGKTRTFLLVCKGNKVKYLAVKKKPVKTSELNEAKKSGYKGDGYFGVLTGKGLEFVFNLSIADGYTAEPVKDKILKDFLEEKAGFKCKPTIRIVETLPDIPFDDEDLSNPLIARFLGLGEQISNVLDVRPDVEGELKKTVTEIRQLLQQGDFETAGPRIDALAGLLGELLSSQPTATAPPQQPSPSPASPSAPSSPAEPSQSSPPVATDALKAKLQEALNKIVPQLKQAVTDHPEKKVELLTPVAQIKKQLDTGDLDEAKKGILAVGQLLKQVMAQAASRSNAPAQPENELRTEYERKLAALQPDYEKALRDMLGDTSKFRAVMAYAIEQATANTYGNAIKAIDRLSQAVLQAVAAASSSQPNATPEIAQAAEVDFAENSGGPSISEEAIRKRVASIEPLYLSILSGNPAERTRLTATMLMATELIEGGEFDRAAITLDRLEKLLANPGQPDIKPTLRKTEEPYYSVIQGEGQLIKYRKALLAWDSAKKSAASQLSNLKSVIATKAPQLVSSAEILDRVLDQLNDQLSDAIDAAMNAEGIGLRAREHARAGELARSYMMTVNFHPAFEAVDRNTVQPLTLRSTLSAGLAQVVAALPI